MGEELMGASVLIVDSTRLLELGAAINGASDESESVRVICIKGRAIFLGAEGFTTTQINTACKVTEITNDAKVGWCLRAYGAEIMTPNFIQCQSNWMPL